MGGKADASTDPSLPPHVIISLHLSLPLCLLMPTYNPTFHPMLPLIQRMSRRPAMCPLPYHNFLQSPYRLIPHLSEATSLPPLQRIHRHRVRRIDQLTSPSCHPWPPLSLPSHIAATARRHKPVEWLLTFISFPIPYRRTPSYNLLTVHNQRTRLSTQTRLRIGSGMALTSSPLRHLLSRLLLRW